MIIQNLKNEEPNDNTRTFSKILKVAGLFCNLFDNDKSERTAKGVFFAADNLAHIINLAYDNCKFYLELRLKLSTCPEVIQKKLMLHQDKWSSLLASVTYEKEDRILRVKAKTTLEPAQNPDCSVRAVFEDLKQVVNDPCFQQISSN
jgi:hypothetical protein